VRSTDTDISQVQSRLQELGLYSGTIDGIFGPATQAALRSFQKQRRLTPDGRIGPQTRNLLFCRFQFENYARAAGRQGGHDWFQWRVFMADPPERLGTVRSVEYRLHETFPDPIRIVEDRVSRFAIESSGWGEFWIFITIYLTDGSEENTQHWLDLSKPWPSDGQ
jgi:peptidoglycan hydrolase-like protein with peptidoglycan-binding domain